jgi:hypothetical protein
MMVQIFRALVMHGRKIGPHREVGLTLQHLLGVTLRLRLVSDLGAARGEKGVMQVVRSGQALEGVDGLAIGWATK